MLTFLGVIDTWKAILQESYSLPWYLQLTPQGTDHLDASGFNWLGLAQWSSAGRLRASRVLWASEGTSDTSIILHFVHVLCLGLRAVMPESSLARYRPFLLLTEEGVQGYVELSRPANSWHYRSVGDSKAMRTHKASTLGGSVQHSGRQGLCHTGSSL